MDGSIKGAARKSSLDPSWKPQTRAVRGGQIRSNFDETSEALFLTSGYAYASAEEAEATFKGASDHYQYSRFGNPTVTMFENRLAALEGAEACRATSTGMSAVFFALLALLNPATVSWRHASSSARVTTSWPSCCRNTAS